MKRLCRLLTMSGVITGCLVALIPPLVSSADHSVTDPVDIASSIASAPAGHPRIFADQATFNRLRQAVAHDPTLTAMAAGIRAHADYLLTRPPLERVVHGRGILDVSRKAIGRIMSLAMAWQLYGRAEYLTRAERELLAVSRFSDWNPRHFLDTAEMTLAVAVGYDWLYADLPQEIRDELHAALLSKGLKPGDDSHDFWIAGTNNWTQVCHAGLMAGSLVLREEHPDLAARLVNRGVVNLPRVLAENYAPDGAYPEGPGYWNYGTSYTIIAIEALRTILGTDAGLVSQRGFLVTGDFIQHMTGPTGRPFNYSDASETSLGFTPTTVWFAREGHCPWVPPASLPSPSDQESDQRRFLALGLIWAQPVPGIPRQLPRDYHAEGVKPVAAFRGSWNDPNTIYLGVCAGSPGTSHGHMDAGSFVVEAQGVRWVCDLGLQSYTKLEAAGIDLWNFGQNSTRWSVQRLNNLGHSTIDIGGRLQVVAGKATINAFSDDPSTPGCSVDLSPVYAGQVDRIQRRFSLPQRRQVRIEDQMVDIRIPGPVTWRIMTRSQVSLSEDGHRAALMADGRTLTMQLEQPTTARFSSREVNPRLPHDAPNPECQAVEVIVPAKPGDDVSIIVTLTPDD